MSSLRTLHDAFAELERQADALPTASPADPEAPARRRRPRRALIVAASVVAAAAIVVAAVGGILRLGGGSDEVQPAAPSHPTTLWKAEEARCPAHPASRARTGAVLRSDAGGCVRLVEHVGTLGSLEATLSGRSGRSWTVDVSLDRRQAQRFERATRATKGHTLAIVDDGEVVSSPRVQAVIPAASAHLQLTADSKKRAEHIVDLLTTP